jgi:uncharacterized protein YndB with AHSA1/START domain
MKANVLMNFDVDKENNKVLVTRTFAAPLERVWAAWTQKELLDQWWAPKPWQARTKVLDFKEGGYWLYAMVGPDADEQWCRADYSAISPLQSYSATDAFCDENGVPNNTMPSSKWKNTFTGEGENTVVHIEITHESLEDLEKIIEMGFKEGFTMGLENLDELLEKQQTA